MQTDETPSSPLDFDEVDTLPSSSASSSMADSEDRERLAAEAEEEWRESLQQLELLLTMVIVPYAGKYFGRKCAFWGWAKFMEWKYPVQVVVTSPRAHKIAGAVEAAVAL